MPIEDRKLFERLHTHVLTLERLLAEGSTLPLAEIIKDIKAAAGLILEATPLGAPSL
jgi:hypothetical protein